MRNWTSPFAESKRLVERGVRELARAGRRLRQRMAVDEEPWVRSTAVSRAARSAVAFCQGMGGEASVPFVEMVPESRDVLLRPFDVCEPYERWASSPAAHAEQKRFAALFFPGIAARLTAAVGLAVGSSDVDLFWERGSFEIALLNESGRFASLFSGRDVTRLNYYSDLGYYYRRGYGAPLAHTLSAPLLEEALQFFSAKSASREKLYFAHAETVLPLLVALELFKDGSPLVADSAEQMASRKWKTAEMSMETFLDKIRRAAASCYFSWLMDLFLSAPIRNCREVMEERHVAHQFG